MTDHLQKSKANKADSPSGEDGETSLALPAGGPQTLASPDEVAFFDKVKKFIDDKVTYHEFLKLINLFVQDMIDVKTLVERAESFIGNAGDVWTTFKKVVGADEAGNVGPSATSAQGGYGFGGMILVESQVVENTPMLDRIKPYLDGPKVKSFGPSYRKLPKTVSISRLCCGVMTKYMAGNQPAMYWPGCNVLGSTQRRVGVAPDLGSRGCRSVHGAQEKRVRGSTA